MKTDTPKISVVMPVYNREKYVAEAINSILGQTFIDFEFIIIDDGSSDSTPEILQSFNDKRIKLILSIRNKGNYTARNNGMSVAKGKYICVMDSDDIALPNRIQKQYDFMEANKQFGLCGSFAKVIGSDEIITAPEDYEEIKVWSMSNIMFRHPTVFIRTDFLRKYNLKYNDSYRYAGDYDFLVKAAHLFPVTNIQEVLLEYRRHPEQISTAKAGQQAMTVKDIILKQLTHFKREVNQQEKWLNLCLMNRYVIKNPGDFKQLKDWANYLLEKNNQIRLYNPEQLANFLKSLLKYILKQYELIKKERNRFNIATQEINEKLNPKFPLLYQKEWTVLPDFTLQLLNIISETKPSVVVECGSGLSTLILGYLVKNGTIERGLTLEHDEQFYKSTKAALQKHELSKFVDLIYAPLVNVEIANKVWQWYDVSQFKRIAEIDLLLVDGPPSQIQKHSRYPALPLLKDSFNHNTKIIVDDSNRTDEKEIINRWLLENPELRVEFLNTEKGMSILKYK